MKVAVTSQGTSLDAAVDPRFGRCKQFILIDTETGEVGVIDNVQNLNAASGAGIQSAETVIRHGAEAVITGHCGPKAFRALSAVDVAVYAGAEGTVGDVVTAFKEGSLSRAESADVDGHWM